MDNVNPTPMKKSSESSGSSPRQQLPAGSNGDDVIVKIDNHDKDNDEKSSPGFLNPNYRVSDSKQSSEDDDFDEDKYDEDTSDEDEDLRFQNQQRQRRQPSNLSYYVPENEGGGEVLKCTSFQRRGSLLRTKTTQSRLMDPPDVTGANYPKSGRYTSVARGSGRIENDDEDESLFDDDNPGDLNNTKIDALTVLQWISLVLILTSLILTIRFTNWKESTFRGLYLWEWEILIFVLICGRLVSGWCVRIAVFFIERNFLLRKRVLYFVYGVRTPVQNCIWLCWVLVAWNLIYETVEVLRIPLLEVINKFMVCMLVATTLWLIKTLIVKVLASSFHVNEFFDRIQDALFNQYVIETLSGPPLVEIQNNQLGEKSMSRVYGGATSEMNSGAGSNYSFRGKADGSVRIGNEGITIDHLHRMNHENVSAWNMKRLMKIIRHGSLTTLDEQLQGTYYDEPGTEIRSEIEAKRAARNIFMNVTRRRSKFIYLDDLLRFLREDEATKTMSILAASPEDERVGKRALKNWVVSVFRERKALALTLNDTKTIVNKLHRMVNVLVGFVILIICLVILNIATTNVLVFISSQLLVVAFIFGNTCKTIFEAIIFLFVMHPFDVGDRCEIDGVSMMVEEMNIMNTIFLKADNQKVYFPNNSLAIRSIGNFYRSPDMWDTIDFLIHVATPADKIAMINQRIINYIDNNKDHWYPNPIVIPMDMYNVTTQKLSIWVQHRINHQDITAKYTRRGKIVDEMVRIFTELDIEYRTYPVDINIRSMPMPVTSTRVPSTWSTS